MSFKTFSAFRVNKKIPESQEYMGKNSLHLKKLLKRRIVQGKKCSKFATTPDANKYLLSCF